MLDIPHHKKLTAKTTSQPIKGGNLTVVRILKLVYKQISEGPPVQRQFLSSAQLVKLPLDVVDTVGILTMLELLISTLSLNENFLKTADDLRAPFITRFFVPLL